jgi:hypothetical protein
MDIDKTVGMLREIVSKLDDDELSVIQFSVPWQYQPEYSDYATDADGAPIYPSSTEKEDTPTTRRKLQDECWNKFHRNPQINTSVRGLQGRLTGRGFETTSEVREVQDVIEEIELDPRNRLYNFWPKYVGRSNVEGELFLMLTCHWRTGFIEVDFIDPSSIDQDGDDDTGIIFHPDKTTMPLFYNINKNGDDADEYDQVPSIFIARYPELLTVARKHEHFKLKFQNKSRSTAKAFKKFKGYYRFVISWDKGFITRRATSYLKTTIQWLNYYEMLKKYEIDHKKSSGAYLWAFKIDQPKDFRLWLSLSDEDRKKTGIAAKKTPGSMLILPPGMSLECVNPQLPSLSGQDTDVMHMAISGLNEPEDVTTGVAKGTYASIKASRGPMSDRISDEIAYYDRFAKNDFWGSVFFLKYAMGFFREYVKVREAVRWKEGTDGPEGVFENVKKRPEQTIDISYPISEMTDFDARAKGLLGVKHGPISDTLGIPNKEIANSLGFGSYGRSRLRKATEEDRYPKLIYTMDAEALQETLEGENLEGKTQVEKKPAPKKPVK